MGGQQLSPKSWHKEIKRCGALWRSMDSQHRDQYKAKAAEEQALRENACFEPLPPKMPHLDLPPAVSEIQGTAAEHLCRNAKKRISRQRVLTSYMKFREAREWQELDGGVCDPDGALALDYIDMHSSEETVGHLCKANNGTPQQLEGERAQHGHPQCSLSCRLWCVQVVSAAGHGAEVCVQPEFDDCRRFLGSRFPLHIVKL